MDMLKNFWKKLKSTKRLQVATCIVIALIVCLICFSYSFPSHKTDTKKQETTQTFASAEEYASHLENKLASVLSKISGVGQVGVVLTLEGGFTYDYATDTETKTTISGGTETSITTQTLILVSNQPVVVKQNYPEIKGVVIVASGASDIAVKLKIISATETSLGVATEKITVLA